MTKEGLFVRSLFYKGRSLVCGALLLLGCGPSGVSDTRAVETLRSGAYLGEVQPGLRPLLFAPGLISTDLHDDGAPIFSPDGKHLLFRKYGVPHDIIGSMKEGVNGWEAPVVVRELGADVMNPVAVTRTGEVYFLSERGLPYRPSSTDINIWVADWAAGKFKNLRPLGPSVNTKHHDVLMAVAGDGTLYLQAEYEDSLGSSDLYSSKRVEGVFQAAVNLGSSINSVATESGPAVAQDQSFIVYSSSGGEVNYGSHDLFVAFRLADGGWTKGRNLGLEVNSPTMDKFPRLSPDDRFLFFVSHRGGDRSSSLTSLSYQELLARNREPRNGAGDVYWVSVEVIKALRPEELPSK